MNLFGNRLFCMKSSEDQLRRASTSVKVTHKSRTWRCKPEVSVKHKAQSLKSQKSANCQYLLQQFWASLLRHQVGTFVTISAYTIQNFGSYNTNLSFSSPCSNITPLYWPFGATVCLIWKPLRTIAKTGSNTSSHRGERRPSNFN